MRKKLTSMVLLLVAAAAGSNATVLTAEAVPRDHVPVADLEERVPPREGKEDGNADTPREPSIAISVVSAASGKPVARFRVLAGVQSGAGASAAFTKRTGLDHKGIAAWQSHTLRVGANGRLEWPIGRTFPVMSLRVEADGYQPQRSEWIKQGAEPADLEFRLVEDWGVWGRVLKPDGKPAARAIVALALPQRNIAVHAGKITGLDQPPPQNERERWRLPVFEKTDAHGRFRLPFESDVASVVLVVHEAGVRELPYSEFQKQPEIALERWGRITGRVQWHDQPGANQEINLVVFRDAYGYPGMIEGYAKTQTDETGRFVFESVMPGVVQLSSEIALPNGNSAVMPGMSIHVRVKSGDATPALLGGEGRSVRGRLTGRDSWEGVAMHFHPRAPHIGFPGDDDMWQAFALFREGPLGPLFFRDGLKPADDGTFEFANVLPGSYQLFVSAPGVENYAGGANFEIEDEEPDKKPPLLDLDRIEVKSVPAKKAP